MAEKLYAPDTNRALPIKLIADFSAVVAAGGSAVIINGKPGKVLKIEEIKPELAKEWNTQRIGKQLDGTRHNDQGQPTRKTELHDNEAEMLGRFEFNTVNNIANNITKLGHSHSFLLRPISMTIQQTEEKWYQITGM